MSVTSFTTDNRTYRQLIGNGLIYRIPPFQRDYAWDEEEWEDLWLDIQGTLSADGEPAHYMGYLVLQTVDNRVFEVIDGQQRLTTLSLIVLAAMRLLKRLIDNGIAAEANQMRLGQLRTSYIGYLDPVTLITHNKLSLNRQNDPYYRQYLVTLTDPLPQRGFPASTNTMRKAFEWFERRLNEYTSTQRDQGRALAQFIETMSDKLFFTVITVSDELNAYRVFETLNARGVRLSATDLLKNYLFAVLARHSQSEVELKELERRWDTLVSRLGSESLPDFLRMHWNSRHSFARQSELFKAIRNRIQNREAVFGLLREMDEDVDTYLALNQPEGSSWPSDWKVYAQELRLFSVRQPYPMLMAAKRRLADDDFARLLRATVVISFRYNVIGSLHTGESERLYHEVAKKIHEGIINNYTLAVQTLRPIYRSDAAFRADFSEKSIKTTQSRNARIVRYILSKLEQQAGGVEFDYDSPAYTIEHILPQSPEAGWEAFSDRDLEEFVYRLGNMTIIESSRNRDAGNKSFAQKRVIYQESRFRLTQQLTQEEEWTPERLAARQREMARLAAVVWRIDI
jgi:hypothetical protein